MELSIKGLAAASAIVWGGAIFLVATLNILVPGYGGAFLHLIDSIYPGYDMERTVLGILTGTGYGLIDGAVCGAVFAWLYNLCASCGE